MKYYVFRWDFNLESIGYDPQSEFRKGYDPNDNGVYLMSPYEFPDFVPEVELNLHEQAKLTDVIKAYGVPFGLIVSPALRLVLKKCQLPPHAFYPIKVYQFDKVYTYYWFHYIIVDFWRFIDRENSKGVVIDHKKQLQPVLDIDLNYSAEELLRIKNVLPHHLHMEWEKIIFTTSFPKYDVYETQVLGLGLKTLVSEKLLKMLEQENITGYTVVPFDVVICE